jgi:hypothetical protein
MSYDHLRNILSDLSLAREHVLDLLIFTLSHMLWQPDYMPRVQIGLPQMNLDGARLLAHCFLFEMDRLLTLNKVEFTRFMDDIDIGVGSIPAAKKVIRDLDLALQTRQIRLNSGKTKILDEHSASKHFCIQENELLDRLETRFEKRRKALLSIKFTKRLLSDGIKSGLENGFFEQGNGEKILKRCINYSRIYGVNISEIAFKEILFKNPAVITHRHFSAPIRGRGWDFRGPLATDSDL